MKPLWLTFNYLFRPTVEPPMNSNLAKRIVILARKEIGVEEVNGTNCGKRVNEYKAATWLDPEKGWPWCAAFVCWLVKEAMERGEAAGEVYTFKRPQTAGAWDFRNWSLDQDTSTSTRDNPGSDLIPGDIVGYTFSHIGIVEEGPNIRGIFTAIEGNTDGDGSREGGGVLRKKRPTSKVKFRIRFRV